MQIEVARDVIVQITTEAQGAHPSECCGILLGEGTRIVTALIATNVHPEPTAHFEIDPQKLIDAHRAAREGGPQVLGYYHSHPNGLVEPSKTDRAQASGDERIWAIIANGAVGFWSDNPDGFEELSYEVVGL